MGGVLNGVPLSRGTIVGTVVPPLGAAAFAVAYLRALPAIRDRERAVDEGSEGQYGTV